MWISMPSGLVEARPWEAGRQVEIGIDLDEGSRMATGVVAFKNEMGFLRRLMHAAAVRGASLVVATARSISQLGRACPADRARLPL